MGKGTRTRAEMEVRKREQEEQQRILHKKKKTKKIILAICSIVIILGISIPVGTITINNALINSGYYLRHTTSFSTESYDVDNTMVSYFYKTIYSNFTSNYSDSLTSMGLDTSTSLKKQACVYDKTITWYDYFIKQTKTQISDLLIFYKSALADGMKLDKDEKADIDKTIESFSTSAKDKSMTVSEYIASLYGKGVNVDDVRRCMEMSYLSNKAYTKYMDSLDFSDDDITKYYADNTKALSYCDYRFYTFTSNVADDSTKDQITAMNADNKALAEKVKASSNIAEFKTNLKTAITEYNKASGTETTDDAFKTAYDSSLKEEIANASTKDKVDKFSEWAFDDSRKVGDTTVIEGTNEYSVYFLVKVPYRLNYITKNARHILITTSSYGSDADAKTAAESIMKEITSADDVLAKFKADATQYSEDSGSTSNGGLYENIKKGKMVKVFEDWCYDSSRKAGDVGIIKSDYGYHIMYFESNGDPAWKVDTLDLLKSDTYDAYHDTLLKKYPVKTNEKNLAKIPE